MRHIWINKLVDPSSRFLLLNDAGTGGAGAGGGGTGGTNGGGSGPGGGTGSGDPWYQPHVASLDRDTLTYLDGKKFPSMVDALKSGAQSDRMARERNVIMRPDTSDPAKLAAWEGWGVLGWNADKAAYSKGINPPKMPNGAQHDAALMDDFVALAHENHIPPAAAEKIFHGMTEKVNARLGDLANQGREATTKLETELRSAWGQNYQANTELAQRAAKALGVGADDSSELEKLVGSPRLLKLFHAIGGKMGEGNLVGGDSGGTAGMTPASAEAELRRLEADPQFLTAFRNSRDPGHQDAKEKHMKLIAIAAKAGNTQAARR